MPPKLARSDKHPHALQGRIVVSVKRKTSGEESTSKKDRIKSPEVNIQPKMSQSGQQEANFNPEELKFCTMLAKSLRNEEVAENFLNLFSSSVEEKIRPLQEKIEEMSDEMKSRDERISTLERKVDDFEQKEREKNVIISGLPAEHTTTEGVRNTLNTSLDLNIDVFAIDLYVTLLNSKRIQEHQPKPV